MTKNWHLVEAEKLIAEAKGSTSTEMSHLLLQQAHAHLRVAELKG